ncbi:MAG: hypothetical protein CMJ62_21295 [Planctomycetaceae bacterium]|nr:hypothetical protein [Planctomycetaceae bacterium]|tara:strand:+ start:4700 stop:5530 length:831 start_codon:yes stop_codon:yes gene_type:complete
MQKKWQIYTVFLVVLGTSPILITLLKYNAHLGTYSSNPEDWGAFGSLLGGLFTYLAAVGTIGTLLFLIIQQQRNEQSREKHERLIIQQMDVLAFEQYRNHRMMFFDKLNELSKEYNGEIHFPERDRVYSSLFYMNTPRETTFRLSIDAEKGTRFHDIIDCIAKYKEISALLTDYKNGRKITKLLIEIADLNYCLGISLKRPPRSGDIFFHGQSIAVNVECIDKAIERIERVLNEIMYFSENQPLESIYHKAQGPYLRDYVKAQLAIPKNSDFNIYE